jgi:hypothetical protein
MLMEVFPTDIRKSRDNGLDAYCRLEGIDYDYLVAEKNRKSRPKPNLNSKKKFKIQKLFAF